MRPSGKSLQTIRYSTLGAEATVHAVSDEE